MRKKHFIAERIVKISEADDGWDIKFWQKAGVNARFSAAWKSWRNSIRYEAKVELSSDYKDLLRIFNKHKVKYFVVGAYAVGFYSKRRYTKDIDILVESTLENAKRVVEAIKQFGFGSLNLTESDFTNKDNIIQLGYEPVKVDILTSLERLNFSQIWKNKKKVFMEIQKFSLLDLKN